MSDLFEQGRKTALNEDAPVEDAFKLSTFPDEYKVGYVTTHAELASFRAAYPDGYPITCGELTARYFLSPEKVLPHISKEDRALFKESYRNEKQEMAQRFAEEEGLDDPEE